MGTDQYGGNGGATHRGPVMIIGFPGRLAPLLQEELELHGHQVMAFPDFQQAYARVDGTRPTVVVNVAQVNNPRIGAIGFADGYVPERDGPLLRRSLADGSIPDALGISNGPIFAFPDGTFEGFRHVYPFDTATIFERVPAYLAGNRHGATY